MTGSQEERNFAPGCILPRVSLTPNLDDLGDRIWDFRTDDICMKFGLLNYWYLDEILDLRLVLWWIETWKCWDSTNVFYTWDTQILEGQRADSSGLKVASKKVCPQPNSHNLCILPYLEKGSWRCNWVKDLENRRSSWTNLGGSQMLS